MVYEILENNVNDFDGRLGEYSLQIKILNHYCNAETVFWMPPYIKKDVLECSSSAQDVYNELFEILKSKKREKMRVREASDFKILDKCECWGNMSTNPYNFEIKSFAPDTSLLGELKANERFAMGNIYSVGLIINIGHFNIIFAVIKII